MTCIRAGLNPKTGWWCCAHGRRCVLRTMAGLTLFAVLTLVYLGFQIRLVNPDPNVIETEPV